jgi:multiple sugar transport system permease protein
MKNIRYSKSAIKESVTAYIFLLPLLIGVVMFFISPIFQTFYYSLTKWKGVGEATFVGLDNFKRMFTTDPVFKSEIKNTFMFVFGSIPATVLIALVIASLLNAKIKGVSVYRVIFFLPHVMMGAVVAMVWKWLLNSKYGLINAILEPVFGISPAWMSDTRLTMLSMCIMAIWHGMGFCIVIILAGLQGIDETYYEASIIDGATRLQQFLKITVPLVTPSLFFLLVTRSIFAFNQFDLVYMLAGEPGPVRRSIQTIVFGIYESGFQQFSMGYASAKSLVLFIIILIVTMFQLLAEKRWVNY